LRNSDLVHYAKRANRHDLRRRDSARDHLHGALAHLTAATPPRPLPTGSSSAPKLESHSSTRWSAARRFHDVAAQRQEHGFPAEMCYWNKDGSIRTDPCRLLEEYKVGHGPTFCPDSAEGRPQQSVPQPGAKPRDATNMSSAAKGAWDE